MNPVPLMKLIEVIRGLRTSDESFAATMELSRRLGKDPEATELTPRATLALHIKYVIF